MAGGDLWKALNRTQVMPSIYNWVLGSKLNKIGKRDEEKVYDPSKSIDTNVNKPNVNELYDPSRPRDSEKMVDSVPSDVVDERPGAGGDHEVTVQNNKVYVPPIRVDTMRPPETPKNTQNYSNVKLSTDTSDKDIPNSDYNKKLRQEVLDYIAYASKFGEYGTPFINQAQNTTLPLLQETAPEAPKFSKDQYFTDAEGKTWFAPGGNNQPLVPVMTSDGKQLSTDLPKFDKNRIHISADEDGNAVIYNIADGTTTPTGMTLEQFDYKYGLEKDKFAFDQSYKEALLKLKEQKGNKNGNRGNGSNNGVGNNSLSGNQTSHLVEKTSGRLIKPTMIYEDQEQPNGQTISIGKQVLQLPNGKYIPWSEFESTYNKLNDPKNSKEALWQLNAWNIDVVDPNSKKGKELNKFTQRANFLKGITGLDYDPNNMSDENIAKWTQDNIGQLSPKQLDLMEEYFKTEK
jgi:hypothetical protein